MKFQRILYYLSPAVCALEIAALCIAYFPSMVNYNNTVSIIALLVMPLVTYIMSLLWLVSARKTASKKMKLLTFLGLVAAVACFMLTALDFGVLTTLIHSIPILLIALLIYWCVYYTKSLKSE